MATQTTYYNLTKPSANDKVNVDVLNNNADIIDTALHNNASAIEGLTASDVAYDNTDSGLTATDVQGAVDETVNKIENLDATQVMMSDGVTSVEDRISANTTDSVIDISAYDSVTNYYTCPHDGYIKVEADGASGNRTAAYIVGMNTTLLMARVVNVNVSITNTVFVRKGTKIYVTRSETQYSGAYFVSLI